MRTVAIVQARMSSTRLPGKVLADLCGEPMLVRLVDRVADAAAIDEIVVATSSNTTDDAIVDVAHRLGLRCHRGAEHDVLSRYVGAARAASAEVVIRITADCPLIDPSIIDRVATELVTNRHQCDYASNVVRRTYPRGLDTEAFFDDTLGRLDRLATTAEEREHVTLALYRSHPELFAMRHVLAENDDSDLRWTVDHQLDLDVVRSAYEALGLAERRSSYEEILAWFRMHPEVASSNAHLP